MEEFIIPLIILIVCALLSGPIALIIAIVALNKANKTFRQSPDKTIYPNVYKTEEKPQPHEPQKPAVLPLRIERPVEIIEEKPLVKVTQVFETQKSNIDKEESKRLEQQIGTLWVLVAGIITVIVGVGFFLKYAYDNALIGPLGRVAITTVAGLVALVAGEITRKRGYGIVAKGVTALGFGILYAAVFSAFRFYQLIGSTPTFVLAILVTLAAMLYAVSLDEILIAVLSLLGGFLTPVLVSTGENLPVPLFSYVLILSVGAMLCAWYRKWRAVSVIAFVGTFVLYTGWFEKFFRQQLNAADKTPEQMVIALGWLGIFFAIYMTLPLLNGLVKKIKAQKEEDVLLVLSNAAITFYYLWTMLYTRYRIELSFCAIGLCMAHLIMMIIVNKRCKEDVNSRLALLAIGLFFLTIAIPLYLKMYAVAMAWAVEAVVLAAIGLRYKSISTQICADIAFVLSLAQLADQMPMHSAAFRLILNPAFGTWLFVSICALVCHILYRANKWMADYYGDFISQIIYSVACFLLMFTLAMEWYWHCEYNIIDKLLGETTFINGIILLFTGFISILAARPICPAGKICKVAATVAAFAGSIFTICGLTESYYNSFTIFANINFAYSILFVAGLLTAVWFFRRDVQSDRDSIVFSYIFAITAIFVLWVLLSEEIYLYWYCRDLYLERIANWGFLANMYMSVMWAIYGALLMVTGFWRKAAYLRYISLGLFALLLLKVFVLDMSTVKSVYRIAAFLATGITLVGISYLYQFLKKKGFFDTILIEEKLKD